MPRPQPETRLNENNIEKKCSRCGEFKPLIEFPQRITGYLGTNSSCKECVNNASLTHYHNTKTREKLDSKLPYYRKYYKENKEKWREYGLNKKYDLTTEEFEKLAENGCHSCGSTDKLCVDHNHITNTVRGILCHNCNTALGLLNEDSTRILKLAYYLEDRGKEYAFQPSNVEIQEE
jgi:hypothetical protein